MLYTFIYLSIFSCWVCCFKVTQTFNGHSFFYPTVQFLTSNLSGRVGVNQTKNHLPLKFQSDWVFLSHNAMDSNTSHFTISGKPSAERRQTAAINTLGPNPLLTERLKDQNPIIVTDVQYITITDYNSSTCRVKLWAADICLSFRHLNIKSDIFALEW